MFYQFWIVYTLLGLLAAAAIFVWAVRNGQFTDQDRARFIPLKDDPLMTDTPEKSAFNPVVVGLAVVILVGFIVIGALVVLSILWA
ncbi:MAG: cbb3-type cytochrome oxidase assembly protein CcoS [Deltaproteobacteria bacterium]|nr:cbb3-type cytochrome oxidase assembly protein CcoS [Deltaproteobacteria bacterium]MBW2309072.1 cbb3-type cytochrome oxidase assembly protein CcoS [Deltaproteobacteria bacterium]